MSCQGPNQKILFFWLNFSYKHWYISNKDINSRTNRRCIRRFSRTIEMFWQISVTPVSLHFKFVAIEAKRVLHNGLVEMRRPRFLSRRKQGVISALHPNPISIYLGIPEISLIYFYVKSDLSYWDDKAKDDERFSWVKPE